MKISLQRKVLYSFIAVIIFVLSILSVGISLLIHNYFMTSKQMELTNKGYEMATVVNDYYEGNINYVQLNRFANNVDSFLNARVWIVDNKYNLVTASEEHAPLQQLPMHQGGNRMGPMGGKHGNGCNNGNKFNQQAKNHFMPAENSFTTVNLADINGMSELMQDIQTVLGGSTLAKTFYHPYYEEDMLVVAVPLVQADNTINGAVILNTSIKELNGFLKRIYYYIGFAGVIAVLLTVFIARRLASSIVHPVKDMQKIATAMAQGDYSVRAHIYAEDEVGELGNSLNTLAEELGDFVTRTEKMEKMRRDFIANISHELRTPLTIMRGYNEALLDGTITEPDLVTKYHAVMRNEAIRLEKLIAELLDLSSLQSTHKTLEMEKISLAEIVENVVLMFKQRNDEKTVALCADIQTQNHIIMGNGDRLIQLLLILLDNALKFTDAHGSITVSLTQENHHLVLTVSDTGCGIPKEDLLHIWDRFYKVDKSHQRSGGGTGVGLAIAKEIIELHGADVHVVSELGQGTSFIIKFPCS